jgi:hypothetical protein
MDPIVSTPSREPVAVDQTPSPVAPKKSFKFPLLILSTFILILAGIGGGYYLGLDHGFEKAQNRAQSISPTPSAIEESVACTMEAKLCPDGSSVGRSGPKCEFAECPPTGSMIDTSTWKSYTSPKYKYSFKYPANWVVTEAQGDGAITTIQSWQTGTGSDNDRTLSPTEMQIEIRESENADNLSVEEWHLEEGYERMGPLVSESPITIDGMRGIQSLVNHQLGQYVIAEVTDGKKFYIFYATPTATHLNVFNTLVTTFQKPQ